MKPQALKEDLDRLLKDLGDKKAGRWGLAPMDACALEATHTDFDTPEAAWHALVQAAPRTGWIQWQSHQTHFTDDLPQPESGWGALLAAEAALTDTDSLRLDYLDGCWRLTCYRHDPSGNEYLCDETQHLLHGANDRYLRYRRYWRIDEQQGAVQTCAVLAGIALKEED